VQIRTVVIAIVVFGAVFLVVRGQSRKAEEERLRREDADYRKSAEVARERNAAIDRERQAAFATRLNCDTAVRNRQVLEKAVKEGGGVIVFTNTGATSVGADQLAAAQRDTAQFIAENCPGR
jgi:hypothetical protein